MKALTFVLLLVLLGGVPAAGQPAPAMTRADLQGTAGWYNIRQPRPAGPYSNDNWMNAIGQADAAVGWYWTEHLRTMLDVGVNSTGRQYVYTGSYSGGQSGSLALKQSQVSIGQQYQFGHNAWFHPHIGGGVLFAFQHSTFRLDPYYYYDPAAHTTRVVGDVQTTRTDKTLVRAFMDVGFKAYVSRSVYFVHDTRIVPGPHGIEQVGFKFGFGVDFR